ncbi:MAG: hypothetical protein KIB40_08485 [Pantoea sp.]|uniref:EAL domain-containing protein n=1 Tax=Pantoea brenneri TaxID=472694 RepID=A0AAX3J252_9GAMM|nr:MULTISPECIES: hypothetical protein [Pantoea]MBS6033177.1 hypothetical protein [Pantoea sp.]MDH2122178.1 hypothetical protein [Pantoea brenneri]VXB27523.1 conserved hypothetical protein [Pantoea brenneri]
MKNSLYNPYVTEPIHHVGRHVAGICYSVPYLQHHQDSSNILNSHNIISLHNQIATEAALMVIPVEDIRLQGMIAVPDAYLHLQDARVRVGINYPSLVRHGAALLELAEKFSFWLYDFAPPGADWRLMESFPFSGIVLSEPFFNDNYQKFTFPYFMAAFRAKGAEVIVRSQSPCLTAEQFAEINISGWQQQRSDGELISC